MSRIFRPLLALGFAMPLLAGCSVSSSRLSPATAEAFQAFEAALPPEPDQPASALTPRTAVLGLFQAAVLLHEGKEATAAVLSSALGADRVEYAGMTALPRNDGSMRVVAVTPGSPAAAAGIQVFDILREVAAPECPGPQSAGGLAGELERLRSAGATVIRLTIVRDAGEIVAILRP